jgi:hypothetical protein
MNPRQVVPLRANPFPAGESLTNATPPGLPPVFDEADFYGNKLPSFAPKPTTIYFHRIHRLVPRLRLAKRRNAPLFSQA